jgi:hypothetical protein
MREQGEDATQLTPGVGAGTRAPSSDRSRLRAALAPVQVAARRIARRPLRLVLVAVGVALATGSLVAVSSSSLVLRERTLRASLAAVAPAQRSFRVDQFAFTFADEQDHERAATRALGQLSVKRPVRAVEFHPLRFGRNLVELTAVEGLGRFARLASGRLPRGCTTTRCEVLEIGSVRLPRVLAASGLEIAPVGRASLATPSVLGDFTEPSNATLLVSSDVDGLAALLRRQSLYLHTDSWVVPIGTEDVHEWEVPGLQQREARAQSALENVDPAFRLTAPDDAFTSGTSEGRIGSRRMLLVGGELAVLLLGFALLAAVGLRRTVLAEWRRLEERGARRSQLWLFLIAETGAAALAGALVGVLLGIGVAIWAASRARVATGAVLAHGLLTPTTLLLVGATWIVATVVLVVSARAGEGPRMGPVRLGDVVAVAVLVAALVAASRGSESATMLSSDRGSIVLLLLFPGLVSLFAALAAQRLLGPTLRAAERGARRRRPSVRLALVALARAPARTAIAVAFLVVSIGLALLAAGYRATLERGVRDESAYQVPLDYVLSEGTQPVARLDTDAAAPLDYSVTQGELPVGPLDVATVARYDALDAGVKAYPVLRRFGDVPGSGTEFTSPVLLGLDPAILRSLHGWRSDFGRDPPSELARLLGSGGHVHLRGPSLPAGTTGFGLAARQKGADVDVTIAVEKPSGEVVDIPLVAAGTSGVAPEQRIPTRGRVVALELSLTQAAADAIAHAEGEGSTTGPRPVGSLELGPLVAYAGARRLGVVTDWKGWIGTSGARRIQTERTTIRYVLQQGQVALLRPREPTDGHPLPLVVSPDVARSAAPGGLVTIENGDQHIAGKIVAVAKRFPGTADGGGSFAIADESHLQTALDASSPGTGRPLEVWVSAAAKEVGAVDAALHRAPFSSLAIASRRELEHEVRASPLSRAIELALGAGALVALGLAVCGLWLTLMGDVNDERGELYDLEAQGVTPAELRGQLRLRIGILAGLGVVGGLVLGLVLSGEIVRLLQVTASGAVPIPPLRREQGWGSAAVALVLFALLGAGLVEATVRRAFREPAPSPSGEVE